MCHRVGHVRELLLSRSSRRLQISQFLFRGSNEPELALGLFLFLSERSILLKPMPFVLALKKIAKRKSLLGQGFDELLLGFDELLFQGIFNILRSLHLFDSCSLVWIGAHSLSAETMARELQLFP